MWKNQSPRQVFELLQSYKFVNEVSEKGSSEKGYTVKSKEVKIPDWYTVPEGAKVYSADDVYQGDV